jgi:hypothetical protein
MRGNEKVIQQLNEALKAELTAIVQYIVHSEMCHNWGYDRIGDYVKKQAIDEMRHAEGLIERILFLDGSPKVDVMPTPKISRRNWKTTSPRNWKRSGNTMPASGSARTRRTTVPATCSRRWSETKRSTPISWRPSSPWSRRSASPTTSHSRSTERSKGGSRSALCH